MKAFYNRTYIFNKQISCEKPRTIARFVDATNQNSQYVSLSGCRYITLNRYILCISSIG